MNRDSDFDYYGGGVYPRHNGIRNLFYEITELAPDQSKEGL